MMNRCVHVTGDFIANAADRFNHTRAPELDGVVDIIQTPETLEKSGGRENYEIRDRNFITSRKARSRSLRAFFVVKQSILPKGVHGTVLRRHRLLMREGGASCSADW